MFCLSGTLRGGLSGMVVAHSRYAGLSIAGGVFSLLLIPIVIWADINKQRKSNKIKITKNSGYHSNKGY
jgi:hypothetical protein